jgi:hypothetical protein
LIGETLLEAVSREALEETACRFTPDALLGVYMVRSGNAGRCRACDLRALRLHRTARPRGNRRALDAGILRTLWLSADEIPRTDRATPQPLVMKCVDDHLAGQRFPLSVLHAHPRSSIEEMDKGVVVGMSGGVDSSVAALLAKRAGYDAVGLFMKNWEDDDDDEYCSTRQDLVDAAAAADVIGIELEAVNFSAEYKDRFLNSASTRRPHAKSGRCATPRSNSRPLDHARSWVRNDRHDTMRIARQRATAAARSRRQKDQSYFASAESVAAGAHGSRRAMRKTSEGCARDRSAECRQARFHRHRLMSAHSRVSQPLSADDSRTDP